MFHVKILVPSSTVYTVKVELSLVFSPHTQKYQFHHHHHCRQGRVIPSIPFPVRFILHIRTVLRIYWDIKKYYLTHVNNLLVWIDIYQLMNGFKTLPLKIKSNHPFPQLSISSSPTPPYLFSCLHHHYYIKILRKHTYKIMFIH